MAEVETNNTQSSQGQTIIVQQPKESNGNGIGTAGFVLALIAVFLGWVPALGWILWVLGLVFSSIGVSKQPRGLAIAGLVISLIGLILIIALSAIIMTALGLSHLN